MIIQFDHVTTLLGTITYPLRKVQLWVEDDSPNLPVWWDMLVRSLKGKNLSQISHLWIQCEATYLYNLKKIPAFFNTKKSQWFDTSEFNVAVVATSTQLSVGNSDQGTAIPKRLRNWATRWPAFWSLLALQSAFCGKKQRGTCWRWGIYSDFNILKTRNQIHITVLDCLVQNSAPRLAEWYLYGALIKWVLHHQPTPSHLDPHHRIFQAIICAMLPNTPKTKWTKYDEAVGMVTL